MKVKSTFRICLSTKTTYSQISVTLKKILFCLAKLNPLYRFQQVSETIINSSSANFVNFEPRSVKILSWNIAKNNYDRSWSKDFLAIVEQYQPDKIFFQEVGLRADTLEILELSQMDWVFAPNFIDTVTNTYST